ncbi:MAG: threonine--tRNA ligase [Bacteroidota bacterium]|jgi:threonyl-tRNA synthetase
MTSDSINVQLPDGSQRTYPLGTTALDVARSLSEGLARQVLAAEVNGEVWDLQRSLPETARLRLLKWDEPGARSTFWHSSAHLLAEALEALYPGIRLGIGPAIEQGFYYDIDFGDHAFSSDDFPKVEKKMLELASQSSAFQRREVPKAEAVAYFEGKGDPYKLELLEGLEDGRITFYTQGAFTDLCRGPHLRDTSAIKAVKLLNTAGAYWRGNEKNKQLTRIYGITFPQAKELEQHLHLLEEARKRDHRKLGKELELFAFSEKVGMGLPLWLPKGAMVREILEQFLRRQQTKAGYVQVVTPHIGHKELYQTSGHWDKYGQDSFRPILTPHEGEEYLLKPMNCPHHCEIYRTKPRSYRDLPLRLAEFGTVYRYEQHGELHGLTRVRGFTQDDAHLFCRDDQVKDEFKKVISLVLKVFDVLGFEKYTAQISLRDPENRTKYIGTDEAWNKAEQAIIEATAEMGMKTVTVPGEAAFYGPKLDFMVHDALGRSWQLGTIQVDYNLPERFDLTYVGADNGRYRPVMIHRAPFGSMERFVALLIEHCAGNFPLWLAPEQVAILPISEKFQDFAEHLQSELLAADIRSTVDHRDEKIGRKIRDAEVQKIPYMLIIGEKEAQTGTVAVRRHGQGQGESLEIPAFVALLQKELEAVL